MRTEYSTEIYGVSLAQMTDENLDALYKAALLEREERRANKAKDACQQIKIIMQELEKNGYRLFARGMLLTAEDLNVRDAEM